MTEVFFYHLQRQPLEAVLPSLLAKSLDRGWKAVVQACSPERVEALDDHLWTYDENSFLPHASTREGDVSDSPIVLTCDPVNPNAAAIRFLVDGADIPAEATGYARIVVIFDGNDDESLARARDQWKRVRSAGLEATYLQQDDSGRWSKRA